MKRFARLCHELDASTATLDRVQAMVEYLRATESPDAAWAVYFLAGGKRRPSVRAATLRTLATCLSGLPPWLFDASHQAAGDLAETIAHVLPPPLTPSDLTLSEWIEHRLLPLREATAPDQERRIASYWDELDATGRVLLTRLMAGGFRGVLNQSLVQQALAQVAGLDPTIIAQRLVGYTDRRQLPNEQAYGRLVSRQRQGTADAGQPYPFSAAQVWAGPVEAMAATLGPPARWAAEWKYDGIRAQLVKRAGRVWIWSGGDELVTPRYPELKAAAARLPEGTVLDGEIVAWQGDRAVALHALQRRLGRKTVDDRLLAEVPVGFVANDLLEWQGEDWRMRMHTQRRSALEAALVHAPALHLSPAELRASWHEYAALRVTARARGAEGFTLKRRDAGYALGATGTAGDHWTWKIEPYLVDAVLIYARAGQGPRAGQYADYTFAVWNRAPLDAAEAQSVVEAIGRREPARPHGLQLLSFAKACDGLSDEALRDVDRVIRSATLEKFGPVRSVKPSLVMALGFEAIYRSARHKSGLSVRGARMLRVHLDKPLHEAATLGTLQALLAPEPTGPR